MKTRKFLILIVLFTLLLAGCGGEESVMDKTPIAESPAGPAATPSPTPVPTSLVVCLGEAPNTFYPYGAPNASARMILQAVYDGPVDHRSYAYQPVILEGLPDIAAGTAVLQTVQVQAGDLVVDNQGQVVELERGVFIRPAGCQSPDCAAAFDGSATSMDQVAAIFVLRSGITWADGTPLLAADSVFGFNLNAAESSPANKFRQARTLSYEALDNNTIKWTGLPGFIDPEYQGNFWLPAPQHQWETLPAEELLTAEITAAKPLGYGPFTITEARGDSITLDRNPNYFRAGEGLPLIDRLVFLVIGQDPETNLDMLRTGECDLLDPAAAAFIPASQVVEMTSSGQITASWADDNGWTALYFGVVPQSYDDSYSIWAGDRPDFFGDVRVRQAVAICLDRAAISAEVTAGQAPVMDSIVPPGHPLANPNVRTYSQDLDSASTLLAEAGWQLDGNGKRTAVEIAGINNGTHFEIGLLYAEHPQNALAAEIITDQLAACGIEVTAAGMSMEELFATGPDAPLFGRNFDLTYFAWQSSDEPPCQLFFGDAIPGSDEEVFPYKWGGWNLTGWRDETYDAACQAAQGSAPGQEAYAANHALAQQILAEQLPLIPIFTYQHAVLARPDICGLAYDATAGAFWNVEELGYGESCP